MQVSTKGRYALRFLLDLAEHRDEGEIPLRGIAERQGISKKYLERIAALIVPTGMVHASRGKQGGYRLARDPSRITVADVLRVTEGSIAPVSCLGGEIPGCERRNICPTLKMWQGLDQVIDDYLSGITLQDLLDQYQPIIEYYI